MKIAASSKYKSKVLLVVDFQEGMVNDIRGILQECNLLINDLESKVVNVDKQKSMKLIITFERDSSLENLYEFMSRIEEKYTPKELKLSHE